MAVTSSQPQQPKLLDRLADALDRDRYTPGLIRNYVEWARRYIFFHGTQHPAALGAAEVSAFLTDGLAR